MISAITRLSFLASALLLSACALWRDDAPLTQPTRMMADPALVMPAAPPAPMVIGRSAPHFASDPQDFVCYDGASLRVTGAEAGAVVQVSLNGAAAITLRRADESGVVTYRANGLALRRAGARATLSGEAATVTVQPGDTLGAIARRLYGDRSRAAALAAANAIANPDLIYPGQVLRLPASERRCRRTSSDRWALTTPIAARGG